MDRELFIAELGRLRPTSTFLNLHNYRNEQGELSDFNIVFHISYLNALKRSTAILEGFVPENDLQLQAKHAVLKSFHTSINNHATPVDEIDDGYKRFFDSDGSEIKGLKMHLATGHLHLYGFVHQKLVKERIEYKAVNSAALTIEKNKLKRMCPVSKFRQFRILPNQVDYIKVQGLHLLPPESI